MTLESATMPLRLNLTCISIALAATAYGALAMAKEFRSADAHAEDSPTVMAVKSMSDYIKQKSNGKDTIKVYSASQLGSEKDTIEQVKSGTLDLVRVNAASMSSLCPETTVVTMPFLFRSPAHLRKVLDSPIGEALAKSCEKPGFITLAFYDSGARSVYTAKKPIKALADAKGVKIRVPQSDLWVALMQAMGASAAHLPYGEVYAALKTGMIDGAENDWLSYAASKQFEVAPIYSLTEHSMAPEMLLMSKKVYDALTPQEQQMWRDAGKASMASTRKLWDEKELASRKIAEKGGAKVFEVDKKSFQDAMKPVYDKFITDPKLKEIVTKIQATN
jgi:tripartite ATP-independent transporter DctP family solute receptor